jgi:hypothetical protein
VDCHKDPHGGRFIGKDQYGDCSACHSLEGFSPAHFSLLQHAQSKFPLTEAHLAVPCIACHSRVQTPEGGETTLFEFADTRCKTCHKDPHQHQVDRWIQTGGCEICHTTAGWRSVKFDHDRTRFKLESRHAETACLSCHGEPSARGEKTKYRFQGMSMECQVCHKDPHKGQFSSIQADGTRITPCERCHTTKDWLAEKFNHDRDSTFPLTGAHRTVACGKCHPATPQGGFNPILYKPIAHRCDSCHAIRTPAGETQQK